MQAQTNNPKIVQKSVIRNFANVEHLTHLFAADLELSGLKKNLEKIYQDLWLSDSLKGSYLKCSFLTWVSIGYVSILLHSHNISIKFEKWMLSVASDINNVTNFNLIWLPVQVVCYTSVLLRSHTWNICSYESIVCILMQGQLLLQLMT